MSGQLTGPANGRIPPFDGQPVQGFSSILRASNAEFLPMSDNGFGAKENSPDYVLRLYRIEPDFRTKVGGTGTVTVKSFITLSDPDRHIDFPIVADLAAYPGTGVPVDLAFVKRGC